jgi:sec-independent protein translocase protein TatB
MFDVGFSELLIIGVVALLVLGPERLPHAARFAGLWVRRARAQWASVRAELERELETERLRSDIESAGRQVAEPMRDLESSFRAAAQDADAAVRAGETRMPPTPEPPPEPPPETRP